MTIPASNASYYRLSVPQEASNVRVEGRFVATGGAGNDLEVYLLDEDGFSNWQNGHATRTFYNSGRATVGDLDAILPDGAGTYYLVLNNRFSLLTPKAAELNAALTYYQAQPGLSNIQKVADDASTQFAHEVAIIYETQPPIPYGWGVTLGFGLGILFTGGAQWLERLLRDARAQQGLNDRTVALSHVPPHS
jgi:hypothetical protein